MKKLTSRLTAEPLLLVILLSYSLAMAFWAFHIFTTHMIVAAIVALALSIIIGLLIYYATHDFKMAISIALFTLPVCFIAALITDRVLEAIWRTSIFHTESDMLDLTDIIIGAIVGVLMMLVLSYTFNKIEEKKGK